MSEVVDPQSANKRPTEYELPDPGYYILQIETHDPRVSGLFTSKAKPPKFGIHDVTPTREFSLLETLRRHAGDNLEIGKTLDGHGTVITLAVEDFGPEHALDMSSMTQSQPDGKRPLLDTFRSRGSSHDYQRVSMRGDATHPAVKGNVERAGQEVVSLIDIDYHR